MANQLSANVRKTFSIGGETYEKSLTVSGDQETKTKVEVAAAQAGTLTVRTDNNTGTITMGSGGHGIVTGQRVDVYWTVAGVTKCQHGVTVGTVAGTSVPIDGGVGDNLPAATSAVRVSPVEERELGFDSDNVVAYGMYSPVDGLIVLAQTDNTVLLARTLLEGAADVWDNTDPTTNPIGVGAAVGKVFMSHGDTTGARTLKFGALLDNL